MIAYLTYKYINFSQIGDFMIKKTLLAMSVAIPLVISGCAGSNTKPMSAEDRSQISKLCIMMPEKYDKRMSKEYGDLIVQIAKDNNLKTETVFSKSQAEDKNCSHFLKYSTRSKKPHLTKFIHLSFYRIAPNVNSHPRIAEATIREKLDLQEDPQKAYDTVNTSFKKMLGN